MQRTDDRRLVWYAAYGSNLLSSRLARYLEGGRAPGASRGHRGARDSSPPLEIRPFTIERQVYFAGRSRLFGGGIAFVDPDRAGRTYARLYLMSWDQFEDLVAQENGRPTARISSDEMPRAGTHCLGPGRYETLVHCGEIGNWPILTFTADPSNRNRLNTPSGAYLSLVAAGLAEAHAIDDLTIADYLYALPTVRLGWSRTSLLALTRDARELHV